MSAWTSNAEYARQAMELFDRVGSQDGLGVPRWDQFILDYPNSGTVRIPVQLPGRKLVDPFYYAVEQLGDQSVVFTKSVKGGEPYRRGDVFGFFGFSQFEHYQRGRAIFLVEGMTDWAAATRMWPWVLATFTAGVSARQWHYLRNLTNKIFLGFDPDKAGARAYKDIRKKARRFGIQTRIIAPTGKDFGAMLETDWGLTKLDATIQRMRREPWYKEVYGC